MKSLIPYIAFLFLITLYLMSLKVQFKPFKITVGDWISPICFILITVAVLLFFFKNYGEGYRDGYLKGHSEATESAQKIIDKHLDTLKSHICNGKD